MTKVARAADRGSLQDAPRPICAIHQPNFLPRLSTLAKIYASDTWVVLNDVQFVRRDYQHRARLAPLNKSREEFWLTLPVHLPHGRASQIREIVIAEPSETRRRVERALQYSYGRSPFWPMLGAILRPGLALTASSGRLQDVTEATTRALLELLGWPGRVVRSDTYNVRNERSARLADLALTTGCKTYFCGTGGARYLNECEFADAG